MERGIYVCDPYIVLEALLGASLLPIKLRPLGRTARVVVSQRGA